MDDNDYNEFSEVSVGVLRGYLSQLRSDRADIKLPYVLSPLHMIATLASKQLYGQAAHIMYSILALPPALFSEGLARQYLAWHLSNDELPFALNRLEEVKSNAGMGWDMYARECALYRKTLSSSS